MKKTLLTLTIVITSYSTYAQTNTFPTTGNAGIGTTSPGSHLEIYELSDSKPDNIAAPTASILKLSRTGTPNYSYNESAEFRLGHGGPSVWGSKLDLFVNGGSNQTNIPDQQVMTWLYNGNVGIGNTNPGALVTVGSTSTRGTVAIYGGTDVPAITLTDTRPSTPYSYTFYNGVSGSGNFDIYDQTASTYRFSITPSGNVGIGTTTPDTKLSVNGTIHSKEVKVDLMGWPDYVFNPKYDLPSLLEVKTYISKNQHLPDMPSEAEVAKNGINLGEIVKVQTKKIEELTLYLINKDRQLTDQQKQLNQQQEKAKQQDERIAALEKALSKLKTNK